ncbi:hypothetical protein GJ496_007059 [Pomphorhynchus laevis]|nr:hypothetical protein GJ496_007059 [Pomphorhynchus laevis]
MSANSSNYKSVKKLDGFESRRSYNNDLERRRREQIKECYRQLKILVPSDRCSSKSSNSSILQVAQKYISELREKSNRLRNQVAMLEEENDAILASLGEDALDIEIDWQK